MNYLLLMSFNISSLFEEQKTEQLLLPLKQNKWEDLEKDSSILDTPKVKNIKRHFLERKA